MRACLRSSPRSWAFQHSRTAERSRIGSTRIHMRTSTHVRARTHTRKSACARTRARAHTHTPAHKRTHTPARAHTRTRPRGTHADTHNTGRATPRARAGSALAPGPTELTRMPRSAAAHNVRRGTRRCLRTRNYAAGIPENACPVFRQPLHTRTPSRPRALVLHTYGAGYSLRRACPGMRCPATNPAHPRATAEQSMPGLRVCSRACSCARVGASVCGWVGGPCARMRLWVCAAADERCAARCLFDDRAIVCLFVCLIRWLCAFVACVFQRERRRHVTDRRFRAGVAQVPVRARVRVCVRSSCARACAYVGFGMIWCTLESNTMEPPPGRDRKCAMPFCAVRRSMPTEHADGACRRSMPMGLSDAYLGAEEVPF